MDVALLVKFVPFSKFLLEIADKSEEGLFAKSFGDENLYLRQAQVTITEDRRNPYLRYEKGSLDTYTKNISVSHVKDISEQIKKYLVETL